jgi:hypothetical protein
MLALFRGELIDNRREVFLFKEVLFVLIMFFQQYFGSSLKILLVIEISLVVLVEVLTNFRFKLKQFLLRLLKFSV